MLVYLLNILHYTFTLFPFLRALPFPLLIPFSPVRVKTMSNSEWNDPEANVLPEKVAEMKVQDEIPTNTDRKRIVVVGLGMVGIGFM